MYRTTEPIENKKSENENPGTVRYYVCMYVVCMYAVAVAVATAAVIIVIVLLLGRFVVPKKSLCNTLSLTERA